MYICSGTRARFVVQNTFGIIISKFVILRKPINVLKCPEYMKETVKAEMKVITTKAEMFLICSCELLAHKKHGRNEKFIVIHHV